MCGVPLLNRICRECYSDPQAVYDTLKQRGMDLLVTAGMHFLSDVLAGSALGVVLAYLAFRLLA
jgi:hypothetical protein